MATHTKLKKRVLFVDDEASVTHLWRVMLEKTHRYDVREENDSRSALQAARDFRPDLLLLDIEMPGLDGADIARLVRSDKEIGHTAILFLSSLFSARDVAAGKRVDGHLCLPKPTSIDELVRTIDGVISRQHKARSVAMRMQRTRRIAH